MWEKAPRHCLSRGPDFLPQHRFVFIVHRTWQARGIVIAIPERLSSVLKHKSKHAHTYVPTLLSPESQEGLKSLLWSMPDSETATVAISSKESRDSCVRTRAGVFCLLTALWRVSKASWKPFLSHDLKPATRTPQLHSWKQVCSPRISGYSVSKKKWASSLSVVFLRTQHSFRKCQLSRDGRSCRANTFPCCHLLPWAPGSQAQQPGLAKSEEQDSDHTKELRSWVTGDGVRSSSRRTRETFELAEAHSALWRVLDSNLGFIFQLGYVLIMQFSPNIWISSALVSSSLKHRSSLQRANGITHGGRGGGRDWQSRVHSVVIKESPTPPAVCVTCVCDCVSRPVRATTPKASTWLRPQTPIPSSSGDRTGRVRWRWQRGCSVAGDHLLLWFRAEKGSKLAPFSS